MEANQNKKIQMVLVAIAFIALLSRYILKWQDFQISENQDSIARFIGFGCLSIANYLNYQRIKDNPNAKITLGLSILLGFIALAAISKIFI